MRVSPKRTLAATVLLLGGCTHPIHLGGDLTERAPPVSRPEDPPSMPVGGDVLVETDRWIFFWGLLEDREPDLQPQILAAVGPEEVLRDVKVDVKTTVLGWILGFATDGIVTQQRIVVEGHRAAAPRTWWPPVREEPQREDPRRDGPY